MEKINLAIIFGGASSEYEISLLSATSVLKNININKYNIYKIGITKQGQMFYYTGGIDNIENDKWYNQTDCVPCVISCDRSHHGIILLDEKIKIIHIDVAFPVLHGKNGEDGTIQGLFTFAGIPFVGCDTLSSACCMDKAVTKALLDNANIKNTKWVEVLLVDYNNSPDAFLDKIEKEIGYPCFVKPANAGSSVGITKADNRDILAKAMTLAFSNDKKVIIEENIVGIELECAVLGNEAPIASSLGEIEPCNEFYDYDAKYLANKTKTYIPARISETASAKIREIAIAAYKKLGCSGLTRVDFFLCENDVVILNELNTIPGFTAISMYPKLFMNDGVLYSELIDKLIFLAQSRN